MTPDANDLCVFAVKRGYIESKEIYCNPLYPTYLSLVEKYQHSPYANGILNNHVAVNPKTDCSLLSDSSEVSFVPMANVQEKTNVVSYDMVAYETVKKGLFKYDNGCSVFLSYNFFSILKESNITQSRLSLDMFRAVTEKFFIEYHQDLSAIPPLANTLVQFCCHSLSNQNPEHCSWPAENNL